MGSVGSGGNSKSTVTLYGKEYELPEKLEYSSPAIKVSSSVKAFEDRHRDATQEWGNVFFDDGLPIFEDGVKGRKGSVTIPGWAYRLAEGMSHIHPRPKDSGYLGGTLSVGDIENFNRLDNVRYKRAVAQEGTYTIVKLPKYNETKADFVKAYKSARRKLAIQAGKENRAAFKLFEDGKISYSEYIKRNIALSNKLFIGQHKWLLENKKKYNYDYSLEV